jgi:hypothetical protein
MRGVYERLCTCDADVHTASQGVVSAYVAMEGVQQGEGHVGLAGTVPGVCERSV